MIPLDVKGLYKVREMVGSALTNTAGVTCTDAGMGGDPVAHLCFNYEGRSFALTLLEELPPGEEEVPASSDDAPGRRRIYDLSRGDFVVFLVEGETDAHTKEIFAWLNAEKINWLPYFEENAPGVAFIRLLGYDDDQDDAAAFGAAKKFRQRWWKVEEPG